jgi:hypothetical protein
LSLDLSTIELSIAFLTALVIASWLVVRENRVSREYENLERLVLLDNQTLQNDLIVIRDQITSAALTANLARQSLANLANAVLRAMKEIDSRLDNLNDRTEKFGRINDDHHSKLKASEILQLRTTMEKLASVQKITEERLAHEIRFNLERARAVDGLLKGFGSRIAEFSDQLNELRRNLSDSLGSPTSAELASEADQQNIVRKAQPVAEENGHPICLLEALSGEDDSISPVGRTGEAA